MPEHKLIHRFHAAHQYTSSVKENRLYHYDAADRQRRAQERPKSASRTDFERDRARILHSAAFRRLGAKTQVLGPSSDDFIRTRLTHSLEVAQVGREIGKELGVDPDVVETACLAHDLGHPPFGHNGEKALNDLGQECGGFEGNAQTFRIVTRLEPKVVGAEGEPAGVNLTRASLDAVCKYPWERGQGPDTVKSTRKYCVYTDDAPTFTWMRRGAPNGQLCIEAQIMDLSDDIAYSVHDIEDAITTRKFSPHKLRDDQEFAGILQMLSEWVGHPLETGKYETARKRLLDDPYWIEEFTGDYASRAQLKDMTSQLIGRFCSEAVHATRESDRQHWIQPSGPAPSNANAPSLGRYEAALQVPEETRAEIELLKGIAVYYVMAPREFEPVYLQQRTLLADLVDALVNSKCEHLEEPFATAWRRASTDAQRLRATIDQVASLTDTSANQWHARLCGLFSTTY